MNKEENYQNKKIYPLTTHSGLSYEEQHLIDSYNYEEIKKLWKKSFPLKPIQLRRWKELSGKLNLPFLPKDNQNSLPIDITEGGELKKFDEEYFTVGEVAKKVGLSNEGVYFYEKKGLVRPVKIDKIRYYNQKTIERIKQIKELEKSYFLKVIKKILDSEENL